MLNLVCEKIPPVHFYELLHSIVDLIEDDEISKTFNYRSLLIETWFQAPIVFKEDVSSIEAEENRPLYDMQFSTFTKEGVKFIHYYRIKEYSKLKFLLSRLFSFNPFTEADVKLVKQIASDFTAYEKRKIVRMQGDFICVNSLISGRLRLADLFLECFIENELIREFKYSFFTRRGNYISDLLLSLGKEDLLDVITNWASP